MASNYLSADDARNAIMELADNYGDETVLQELVFNLSGDDAREFLETFQRLYAS